jgi:predicted RND superfamily exporter protein
VVVKEIEDQIDPPGAITATPSGLAVVGVGLLDNLEANRVVLTYLAVGFVGLFLAFRLRSIVRSLLSLVPVLIAVGTASLVAYVFDLKLSPMTAVGGPLVVAACTEFTSLILLRYIEERERGLEPRAAVDVTASRTGRAFIVSAMTAIAGVAVIAFSSLPLLQDFGIIVAMNVAVALLSALVILPPMLVWADQWGWVSKGMPDDASDGGSSPEGAPEGPPAHAEASSSA